MADTKIDKTELRIAKAHVDSIEFLLDTAKSLNDESEEGIATVNTLEYVFVVMKNHYRNMLHCVAIAEKGA